MRVNIELDAPDNGVVRAIVSISSLGDDWAAALNQVNGEPPMTPVEQINVLRRLADAIEQQTFVPGGFG